MIPKPRRHTVVTVTLTHEEKSMLDELCVTATQKIGKTCNTSRAFRCMLRFCHEHWEQINFSEAS